MNHPFELPVNPKSSSVQLQSFSMTGICLARLWAGWCGTLTRQKM